MGVDRASRQHGHPKGLLRNLPSFLSEVTSWKRVPFPKRFAHRGPNVPGESVHAQPLFGGLWKRLHEIGIFESYFGSRLVGRIAAWSVWTLQCSGGTEYCPQLKPEI